MELASAFSGHDCQSDRPPPSVAIDLLGPWRSFPGALTPLPRFWVLPGAASTLPPCFYLTLSEGQLPADKWSGTRTLLMPSLGDEEGHLPERAPSQDSQGPHLQLALVNAQSRSFFVCLTQKVSERKPKHSGFHYGSSWAWYVTAGRHTLFLIPEGIIKTQNNMFKTGHSFPISWKLFISQPHISLSIMFTHGFPRNPC